MKILRNGLSALTKNYRSTKTILTACYEFIRQNENAATEKLECEAKDTGEKIAVCSVKRPLEEGLWIAARIHELVKKQNISYKDIAVLVRINYKASEISRMFEQKQIPHFVVEDFKFFRRAEIKDTLAYLRLLINRNDAREKTSPYHSPPHIYVSIR